MTRRIEPLSAITHRKPVAVALTAIATALILAACGQSQAPAGMPQGAGAPPEVGVFDVHTQTVPVTSELSGRTVANVIAEIRPQIGGIVQKRLFREGGDVKAGELLYQIDPALYQASFDSASATLAKAEANVATARLKAQRYQELIADKAVSQQAADDAKAALLQADADVAAAKAAVESARINLAYTRIVSPIAGRISKSAVTQGALVTANQATALATVQQLDPINVDVTQTSTEILQMRRAMEEGRIKGTGDGQARVKLILDNGEVYPLEGKLAFSEATVDAGTGSLTLRAVFPNPKHDLLPGMYVRAVIEQGVRENSIVVPQQGVAHDPQGNAVGMIVNAEGKVEARPLKTERAIGNQWLVSEGLQTGDKLIVEGLQKARPGSPVTAVPAGSKAPAAQGGAANAPADKATAEKK